MFIILKLIIFRHWSTFCMYVYLSYFYFGEPCNLIITVAYFLSGASYCVKLHRQIWLGMPASKCYHQPLNKIKFFDIGPGLIKYLWRLLLRASSSSFLDRLVFPQWLVHWNRYLSVRPWKMSLCMVTTKSWWRLTTIFCWLYKIHKGFLINSSVANVKKLFTAVSYDFS